MFEKNSQTYLEDWEHSEHWKSIQKDSSTCIDKVMVDKATCIEKVMVDKATCVENNMVDSAKCIEKNKDDKCQDPTVLDIHGCKYFGQLVSNELLRFKPCDRNIKMQKILDIIREQF